MNSQVDWFFDKETKWQKAYRELRELALSFDLTEELKWGCPCYTFEKSNVFLIHGFKDYCALLFMKGAIMKDQKGILVQQTKNVQSARQIRFSNLEQVIKQKSSIRAYIKDAIETEKSGVKVELKTTTEFNTADEFQSALHDMPELKTAFEKLTPGRQRGYLLYFGSAKQAKTRNERIEKYIPKILDGKGLDD